MFFLSQLVFIAAFFPSSLRGRFCGQNDVSRQFDATNGVVCKALGCSGKIMCVHPNYKRGKIDFSDDNKDRILIEFDSLQEQNKNGNPVGKERGKRHSFREFSEQRFEFTPQTTASYQGIRAKNFNFTSTLHANNASLRIMVYLFDGHGNTTFGNETTEMREGMLKFNIEIKNWQFCGKNDTDEECNAGDEGEFIDVTLVIKSKGKPKQKSENELRGKDGKRRHPRCFRTIRHKKCPKQFDIGGDSEIVLSSQVMVDDEIRDMPGNGDYPKFKETANKQKFILRFPKAANRIFYDPGLEVGEADAGALVLKNLPHLSLALLVLRCILF